MSTPLNISEINFDSDKYTKGFQTKVKLSKIIVVVGPNNSGKSQLLRDIESFPNKDNMKIISSLELNLPSEESEIESLVNKFKTDPQPDGLPSETIHLSAPKLETNADQLTETIEIVKLKNEINVIKSFDKRSELGKLLRFYRVRLDGKTRFDLISPKQMGIKLKPGNFFVSLILDDVLREELRNKIFNEFGWYFYFENNNGQYAIKTSREYRTCEQEKSDKQEDLQFLADSNTIEEQGHGFQSFVGLMLAVSSLEHTILLIDEPEAYLHPPQAQHLGQQLAELAEKREGTLIASTHSSDFLMGCIEQSENVTIIRLTYDGPVGTIRNLTQNEVVEFIKEPLLRSTETLNALFHKSAIISEGDSDRIFYGTINRRLQYSKKEAEGDSAKKEEPKIEGIDDTIFLNGLGKNTLHKMVSALRKIGSTAVCIYDLDILERGDSPPDYWIEYLTSMNVPQVKATKFEAERIFLETKLKNKKEENGPDPFRKLGISTLDKDAKTRAENFLNELEEYGIFVVREGGVEKWLQKLGVEPGNKKRWLIEILEKLGYDKDPDAIKPDSDDVWEFIRKISQWISNPNKLGMPFSNIK